MHTKVTALCQNVALVMVKKYVEFDENSFISMEVMATSVILPRL